MDGAGAVMTAAPAEIPGWLSALPEKRQLYAADIYFKEAWLDVDELCGGGGRSPQPLDRLSFALFKPEAVVGRRIGAMLAALRRAGLVPLSARLVACDRHTVRQLWRYQLNAAPVATLAFVDLITASTDLLLVMLGRPAGGQEPSAALRLRALKGELRRRALGGGTRAEPPPSPAPMLSFVHAPDEPADVVREAGVLFDRAARRALLTESLRALRTGAGADVATAVDALYARYPRHSLDLHQSLTVLCKAANPQDRGVVRQILRCCEARALPDGSRLLDLLEWLRSGRSGLPCWDRIVIAARLVELEPPEAAFLL